MLDIISWCNTNNGFLSGVLSLVGLLFSLIAVAISLRTARLPYKKRIILSSSLTLGYMNSTRDTEVLPLGLEASATNAGNRKINLTYLGYALMKDGKMQRVYPINREYDCKGIIAPAEIKCVQLTSDEIVKAFSTVKPETTLYVFAVDSENNVYKRKAGTAGKALNNFQIFGGV